LTRKAFAIGGFVRQTTSGGGARYRGALLKIQEGGLPIVWQSRNKRFRLERRVSIMTRNFRGLRFLAAGFVSLACAWGGSVFAQDSCGCTTARYRIAYDEEEVTRYRLVFETEMREHTVSRLRPVVETEMRERRYRVARPVTETSEREYKVKVLRPVVSTEVRDRSYDRTTWVEETEERERVHEVLKPVYETSMRRENYTVRRAVDETQYQDRSYVVAEPHTSLRPQTYDAGGYVDQLAYAPGNVRNRLTWLNRGYQLDPATGAAYFQRGGLHWVPTQKPGTYQMQRAYVPNYVTGYVPETTVVNRVVNEQVPVQVRRYYDEVETREVPQQTVRYEKQQVVERIPVKVRRPVVERIERKDEVQVTRWEECEEVRRVPITQTRMEYEEKVEEIPVKTTRYERVEEVVEQPVRVGRWAPYTSIVRRPRLVPIDDYVITTPVDAVEIGKPIIKKSTEPAGQKPTLKSEKPAANGGPVDAKASGAANEPTPVDAKTGGENKGTGAAEGDLTEAESKKKPAPATPPAGGINPPGNGGAAPANDGKSAGSGASIPGSLGKYTKTQTRPAPATKLASNRK
jgi:hypothetical protein